MRSTTAAILLAAAPAAVLAQDASCSPLHYIYARATTEPPQNYGADFQGAAAKYWSKGYGAAGYSLYTNITKLIPGTTGWPVHYPASMGESAPKGVADMIDQISKMAKACPKQKYVLGGHSQGGMVTVSAVPKIPKDLLSRVVAVTMFGAPPCPAAVRDRCKSYCNKGDFVCDAAGGGKGGKGGKGGMPKGGAPKGGAGKGGKAPGGGKGGMPKMPKGPGAESAAPPAEAAPAAPAPAPKAAEPKAAEAPMAGGHSHGRRADMITAPLINEALFIQEECGAEPEEKGHVAAKGGNAHLAYNADAFYVKAAACYVAAKYKASGAA